MNARTATQISSLTGLRAIAAWSVVAHHFASAASKEPLIVSRLVEPGHVAVDFFFILSGFVLARSYSGVSLREPGLRRRFWWRRWARIYPLYIASLALGFWAERPGSLRAVTTAAGTTRLCLQVLLLNAWSHRAMFRLNWAAWSLSCEVFFYALFPWIVLRVDRLMPRALVRVILLCWALTFVAPTIYTALDPDHLARSLVLGDEVLWGWYLKFFPLQRLPEFVAGVAAARIELPRSLTSRLHASLSIAALALLLGAILLARIIPYAYLHSGVLLPIFVALVILFANAPSFEASLVARPWLVTLGHASYATYILHVPLFVAFAHYDETLWEAPLRRIPYAICLVITSLVAYFAIEEPLRRWLTRRLP